MSLHLGLSLPASHGYSQEYLVPNMLGFKISTSDIVPHRIFDIIMWLNVNLWTTINIISKIQL